MAQITQDMIISDIIGIDRGLAPILMRHGMNCVGCPAAQGESLEQAAMVHGMDVEGIVEEMNVYLQTLGAVSE